MKSASTAQKAALGAILALLLLGAESVQAAQEGDAGGQHAYLTHCASCHGDRLVGQFGKPLTGAEFTATWAGKGAALRARIAATMPPAAPGELPASVYDGVTAYLLAANGLDGAQGQASTVATPPGDSPVMLKDSANLDAAHAQAPASRQAVLDAIRPVDEATLRNPPPGDWLSFRRTDDAQGFSPLDQINRTTAAATRLAWSWRLPASANAIAPLARDGVLFVNSNGIIQAIDARAGELLWEFSRTADMTRLGSPISQPTGMAIWRDRLIVPTMDDHLIALDLRTGKPVWDQLIPGQRRSLRISAPPLIVGGRIIQGMAGCAGTGEPGGCFVVALDADSGRELWRFHTIARPGAKHGDSWNGAPLDKRFGASVWMTPSYDAQTGLIYVGTAQTYHIAPLMADDPTPRPANAALYTNTTLALDPATGKLVWHYQHQAREVWDLDWSFERTLATLDLAGKRRRVVMTMGKIGILDILDARTGRYLGSRDLGYQTLITRIDPKTGWKTTDPALDPSPDTPRFVCPYPVGVRNRPSTSFDAASGLLYVPVVKSCMTYLWRKGEGFDIVWGLQPPRNADGSTGAVVALDVAAGKTRWVQDRRAPQSSAALATAGGVLFEGVRDRWFRALDSATGAPLWQVRLDSPPSSYPISFLVDGVQHVAVITGGGNPHEASVAPLTPEQPLTRAGTTLWVFRAGGCGERLRPELQPDQVSCSV